MALLMRIRSHNKSQRSESARRGLRDRRGLKLAAALLLASLVVLVPGANAALAPSDAVCDGTGMLASENGGLDNTACGYNALNQNTTGVRNTAAGSLALFSNTTGFANTAVGESALRFNTTGGSNTAAGESALISNTTGNDNTAAGYSALSSNTTGNDNTAAGTGAGGLEQLSAACCRLQQRHLRRPLRTAVRRDTRADDAVELHRNGGVDESGNEQVSRPSPHGGGDRRS
jgi:hypothetical protein